MITHELFWSQLDLIQNVLHLDDKNYASFVELSSSEYLKLKSSKTFPKVANLDHFCKRLKVSQSQLFEGDINYISLKERFLSTPNELPYRYRYGSLSKSRTIINLFDYIETAYGLKLKLALIEQLGIPSYLLDSPDHHININLITDLCDLLKKIGFTKSEFVNLGLASFYTNYNNSFGQYLRKHRNIEEMFYDLCSNLSHEFEKNFSYKLERINDNKIIVLAKPTEQAKELLGTHLVGTPDACLTKQGVFATFPRYLGYQYSKVEKTDCLYENHSYTKYSINFS